MVGAELVKVAGGDPIWWPIQTVGGELLQIAGGDPTTVGRALAPMRRQRALLHIDAAFSLSERERRRGGNSEYTRMTQLPLITFN